VLTVEESSESNRASVNLTSALVALILSISGGNTNVFEGAEVKSTK
jgi:hypothetical protein